MHREKPQSLYQKEKARREAKLMREEQAKRDLTHEELMAEAKREFEQMINAGKESRRAGRPRKAPAAPVEEIVVDDLDESL